MPTPQRHSTCTPTSSRSPTRKRRQISVRSSPRRGQSRHASAPGALPRPPLAPERDRGGPSTRRLARSSKNPRRARRLASSVIATGEGSAPRKPSTPPPLPIAAACARYGLYVADHVAVVAVSGFAVAFAGYPDLRSCFGDVRNSRKVTPLSYHLIMVRPACSCMQLQHSDRSTVAGCPS